MSKSLVQALEGLRFPCDRRRVIEHAQHNNLASSSITLLEMTPDRQFRDMADLLSAVPSKSQARSRRLQVIEDDEHEQQDDERAEADLVENEEEDQQEDQPEPRQSEGEWRRSEGPEGHDREQLIRWLSGKDQPQPMPPMDLSAMPLQAIMQIQMQMQRMWMESLQTAMRFWFPWGR